MPARAARARANEARFDCDEAGRSHLGDAGIAGCTESAAWDKVFTKTLPAVQKFREISAHRQSATISRAKSFAKTLGKILGSKNLPLRPRMYLICDGAIARDSP